MLTTLEDITRRLVEVYEPDRVILFGSQASGKQKAESDIDLLIVKETAKRPIDRRVEVERILADRAVPIDVLVYTPQELRDLYWGGSPFIGEVLETGRLLYMRNVTKTWLDDAQDELETASLLCEHHKYRGACYHSQQCVEKALKALLLEKGIRPARTHDLLDLRERVLGLGYAIRLSVDEAAFLNSVYRGRYPTDEGLLPSGEPREEDAHRALGAARQAVEDARACAG